MSVLMVLEVTVDPEAFKRVASENEEAMTGIAGRGKERGAISHMFVAGDGKVMVVDEWDSADSFNAFFEAEGPNIGPLMAQAGAQVGEPRFYEKIDTPDAF
jgi:heme-degrading monooxygenase HmoA